MRRTNFPKFELWHTLVTIFAMVIAMQIMSGLLTFIGTRADYVSGVAVGAAAGFLFLSLLAIIFLTLELLKQARMLQLQRREARVKSTSRRLR